MTKSFWRAIALSFTAILTALILVISQLFSTSAEATTPPPALMAQVTSVDQLVDVKRSEPYFQALQFLVERYGCFAAFPDKTFRGNRPIMRSELVGTLNACLDRMNELAAAATADLVKTEDLETTKRLLTEISTEIGSLRR